MGYHHSLGVMGYHHSLGVMGYHHSLGVMVDHHFSEKRKFEGSLQWAWTPWEAREDHH